MFKLIKFEQLYAFFCTLVLAIALFIFANDKETTMMILDAFIGSCSAITTYFYTKHIPQIKTKGQDNENKSN